MRIGSIYVYEHPETGLPMYVGSTQDGNTMRRHRHHLKGNKGLFEPWLKSFENLIPIPREITKIQYHEVSEIYTLENFYMVKYQTREKFGGLNRVPAGPVDHVAIGRFNLGKRRTPEQKLNISKARKGKGIGPNNPFFGKSHDEATRQRISDVKKARIALMPKEERLEKFGKNTRGKPGTMTGKKLSEEAKAKMRARWAERRRLGLKMNLSPEAIAKRQQQAAVMRERKGGKIGQDSALGRADSLALNRVAK